MNISINALIKINLDDLQIYYIILSFDSKKLWYINLWILLEH